MSLIETPAVVLRRRMMGQELSPVEVLDAFIARIEAADPAINAFTATCFDEARATAAALEAAIRRGEDPGLLAGLPVGIKDMNHVKGLPATYGSLIYADFVPEEDDRVVRFIREEGGVIVGKTNTTEFGAGNNTTNRLYGATLNPFDPTKTSGGSSGGSGAALALDMVPLCHGTDTGGSLRVPATFCGITSLKPTPGLIAHERRVFAHWPFMLQGAMGRTVDDVALLTAAMARDESIDAMSYPRDRLEFADLAPLDLSGVRVAFSPDLGLAPTSKMIRRVFSDRIGRFRDVFQDASDAHPNLETAVRVNWVLRGLQYLQQHKGHYAEHRDKLSPNVVLNYEQALALTTEDIAWALAEHNRLHQEVDRFFQTVDLLICPGATVGPFPVEEHYVAEIDGVEMETYVKWATLTNVLSAMGTPVVAMPCGRDEDGMPFGFQVVGPRRADAFVLRAAKALEALFAADPALQRPIPAATADR